MRRTAALVLCVVALPVHAQEPDPRAPIVTLYKITVADLKTDRPTSPFFESRQRLGLFSRSFDRLIAARQAKDTRDHEASIDFDPVTNSQDADPKDLTIETDRIDGGTAIVSAHFKNLGRTTVVTYDLIREAGAWMIDDIEGSVDTTRWSVRKMLDASK